VCAINNCYNKVGELFRGTEGSVAGGGRLISDKKAPMPEGPQGWMDNPCDQEHVALLQGITSGKPINEGKQVAESCMAAIMGRIASYTGQMVRWAEVMTVENSPHYQLTLSPTAGDFEKGDVKCPAGDAAPVSSK
jgi:myo-inositol 2-dehydrogenase / D-chiro-inositol 1-dehydrogenase